MLGDDRSVSVEVGLKGSDADRLAGTRIFDAQRDRVDPALVAASTAPIIAYVTAHIAVTGADGSACLPGAATLVSDGDGVIFRNRFSCRAVGGDIVYRSTVLTDVDPAARQVVLIGEGDNAPQALLDAANVTLTLSAPALPLFSTLGRYLTTGIEHIFLGYDHIGIFDRCRAVGTATCAGNQDRDRIYDRPFDHALACHARRHCYPQHDCRARHRGVDRVRRFGKFLHTQY